jgi:hypothetical protein
MHVLGTYYEKLVKKSTTLIIWQILWNREFPLVKSLIYLHSTWYVTNFFSITVVSFLFDLKPSKIKNKHIYVKPCVLKARIVQTSALWRRRDVHTTEFASTSSLCILRGSNMWETLTAGYSSQVCSNVWYQTQISHKQKTFSEPQP